MTYTRLEEWSRALIDYLEAQSERPFVWGERDCCAFASDGVAAMTGIDPLAPYRGRYASALGARRILDRIGGVEGFARGAFGEPVSWRGLRRGDIALLDAGRGGRALGIVAPSGAMIIGMGEDGTQGRAVMSALMGWRVG